MDVRTRQISSDAKGRTSTLRNEMGGYCPSNYKHITGTVVVRHAKCPYCGYIFAYKWRWRKNYRANFWLGTITIPAHIYDARPCLGLGLRPWWPDDVRPLLREVPINLELVKFQGKYA